MVHFKLVSEGFWEKPRKNFQRDPGRHVFLQSKLLPWRVQNYVTVDFSVHRDIIRSR